jgi:hypothetical protein
MSSFTNTPSISTTTTNNNTLQQQPPPPRTPSPSNSYHQDDVDIEAPSQQQDGNNHTNNQQQRKSRRRPLPAVSLQPLPSAFQPFEHHRPKLRHLSPDVVAVAATNSLVGQHPTSNNTSSSNQQQNDSTNTLIHSSSLISGGILPSTTTPPGIVRRSSSPIFGSSHSSHNSNNITGNNSTNTNSSNRPVSRCCMCVEVHYDGNPTTTTSGGGTITNNGPRTARSPTSATSCLALMLCLLLILSIVSIGFTVLVLNVRNQQGSSRVMTLQEAFKTILLRMKRGVIMSSSPLLDFKQLQSGLPPLLENRFDPTNIPGGSDSIWNDIDITTSLRNGQRVIQTRLESQQSWSQSTLFSQWKSPDVALCPFGIDYPDARGLFPEARTYIFYGAIPAGDVSYLRTSCQPDINCRKRWRDLTLGALREISTDGYVRLSARQLFPAPPTATETTTTSVTETTPSDSNPTKLSEITEQQPFSNLGLLPELIVSIIVTGGKILHLDNVIVDADLPSCVRAFVEDHSKSIVVLYCGLSNDGDLFTRQGLAQTAIRRFLRPFGQMAVLIRGSGYPLFPEVATSDAVVLNHARAALLVSTSILVQDDSGLPFSIVQRHLDNVRVFGTYRGFVDPSLVPDLATTPASVIKSLFQKDLALVIPSGPLPSGFTFGHRSVVGYKVNNDQVMVDEPLVKRTNWKGSHMIVAYGKPATIHGNKSNE